MADKFNANALPSSRVCLATAASWGAALTSLTTSVNRLVTESMPSVTAIPTPLVLGPCSSEGVHVSAPADVTVKPTGPPTNENVSGDPSGSVALTTRLKGLPSSMTLLAMASKTGSLFNRLKANRLVTGLLQ